MLFPHRAAIPALRISDKRTFCTDVRFAFSSNFFSFRHRLTIFPMISIKGVPLGFEPSQVTLEHTHKSSRGQAGHATSRCQSIASLPGSEQQSQAAPPPPRKPGLKMLPAEQEACLQTGARAPQQSCKSLCPDSGPTPCAWFYLESG